MNKFLLNIFGKTPSQKLFDRWLNPFYWPIFRVDYKITKLGVPILFYLNKPKYSLGLKNLIRYFKLGHLL